jgi:type I restriction enzyme S subunit
MKLPNYPQTTPSRIQSMGNLPCHWAPIPLKYVTRFVNGMAFKPDEWSYDGVPIIRIENLNGGDEFNRFDGEVHDRYHVKKGDLLFGWSGNRGTSFGPFDWHKEGLHYLNQHIFRLAEYECDKRWLYWTLKALTKTIEDEAHGIIGMVHITKGDLGALKIPQIPVPEQKKIAAFLDWKTGQIDALIARKQALLEKLKERRLAVITQAVTRGLNPRARLRDSSIPWLGEVPEHWDVLKMSWVCKSIRDGTHNPPERAPGIHRLLSVRNVQNGRFELLDDDRTMTPEDFAELQRSYAIEEGDIVLAIVGATTGKSAIVGRVKNVTVQRSLAILRPDRDAISSPFLHYIIQSPVVQTEIALTVFKYSAQPGIYLDDVGRLPVVKPPREEQRAIAEWLDDETTKLDSLADRVESAIDRLTEYRAALITAATTGQIDVRNVEISESVA